MKDDSDANCPQCDAVLTTPDDRFSTWCAACDWNVDPLGREGPKSRARELARHASVFRRTMADGPDVAPSGAAAYGALVLATAVNLATAALVVTGVWLLFTGTLPQRVLGAVELLAAVLLFPRPARPPRHTAGPATAPALHAIVGRICAELGTRPPDLIAFDAGYGSRWTAVGRRRRRALVLGLPLWETLTTDQRLALLVRELAHVADERLPRARWIRSALDSLTGWEDLLRPDPARSGAAPDPRHSLASGGRASNIAHVGEMFARPLLGLLAQGAHLLHALLRTLDGRCVDQAYRADRTAARIATAASTEGLLQALLLEEPAALALQRLARRGDDPWEALRDYLASVPDSERARRLRLSELRGDASGSRYPPTCLRIRFVRALPRTEPTVTMSGAEARTVDLELAAIRSSIGRECRQNA
ncbi:M48 family metallopeptidase [Streptomyces sp. JV184]|uniref:M48 family metallopeptidase n=1 Tax=Streptomyces sp. JV184 TaxID=858637 RepID=UPI002E78FED4|nr:M48 family metallopeptidase [Streptomyces sp. JV184]MEE1749408.1 M48 family metallopeptidase [Streptomyces sp. JV184]